jgi:hypothetical protein
MTDYQKVGKTRYRFYGAFYYCMYSNCKSFEDITSHFRNKATRVKTAKCITQVYPNDNTLLNCVPVANNLIVGAQLEPDPSYPFQNILCLVPIVSYSDQNSIVEPANYDQIKFLLEEFVFCTKACLVAYERLKNGCQYGVTSLSSDEWIANNYMAIYNSLQNQIEVECLGIEVDPKKCWIDLEKSSKVVLKFDSELDKVSETHEPPQNFFSKVSRFLSGI